MYDNFLLVADTNGIFQVDLETEAVEIIVSVSSPRAIAYDHKATRIYWGDTYSIGSIFLDGSDVEVLVDHAGGIFYLLCSLLEFATIL